MFFFSELEPLHRENKMTLLKLNLHIVLISSFELNLSNLSPLFINLPNYEFSFNHSVISFNFLIGWDPH